jgi:hypothetical protein
MFSTAGHAAPYGESVAPDGGDVSIRSKRRDKPRYGYELLASSAPTAIEIGRLGPRRQGSGGITPPAMRYPASGVEQRASCAPRPWPPRRSRPHCHCLSPTLCWDADGREAEPDMIETAAGTAKRSAITARIRGDRNVMRAICSRTRVTLLAISPTMIAPIGHECCDRWQPQR